MESHCKVIGSLVWCGAGDVHGVLGGKENKPGAVGDLEPCQVRNALERALGREVLRSVKVVVAHPIDRCLFRDTYYLNYSRSLGVRAREGD